MYEGIVTVDVHGMNPFKAEAAVNSALRRSRGAYIIRIIHGHNNGTVLRDAVRKRFKDRPGVLEVRPGANDGITELILKRV
ncbi:MAG: Smr/MutS family protein [Clostridia bacterium]|nr:Smr/MutS family protein [Clostridia bacterium]